MVFPGREEGTEAPFLILQPMGKFQGLANTKQESRWVGGGGFSARLMPHAGHSFGKPSENPRGPAQHRVARPPHFTSVRSLA